MDTNAILRLASAGNLTGDEALTAFVISPMVRPIYLHTNVPAVSSGDTMVVKAEFKHSSTVDLTTFSPTISAAGHYVIPVFCDDPNALNLTVTLDITKNDTVAANFGAVVVWLSPSRVS